MFCVCVCVRYLKDSCPGVSMINMPGIFRFSFSNCKHTRIKMIMVIIQTWVCACAQTSVLPYVFDHLCLLLNRLFRDICGSDLLSDSSSLAVLNVSVSQLHKHKQ